RLLAWRLFFFFFQAEDGIRDFHVTGVQTCALPISWWSCQQRLRRARRCRVFRRARTMKRREVSRWSASTPGCWRWRAERPPETRSEERRVGKGRRRRWAREGKGRERETLKDRRMER